MATDDRKQVIVGVGPISLSTEDGETHLLVAAGESSELSTMELDCLHSAIHAYTKALEE